MINRLGFLVFTAIFLVTGCSTPYQPQGLTGGFSETRIDENTYQVKFFGNGNTSGDKVWYYWIYRCAELTKSKGYTAFVLNSDKPTAPKSDRFGKVDQGLQPAVNSEENSGFASAKGGGYYYVPSYGGGTITTYSSSAIVRFLREPIPDDISYFRAQNILDALKNYIASEGNVSNVPARADLLKRAWVAGKTDMAIRELPGSTGSSTLDDFKGLLPAKK